MVSFGTQLKFVNLLTCIAERETEVVIDFFYSKLEKIAIRI